MKSLNCPRLWKCGIFSTLVSHRTLQTVPRYNIFQSKLDVYGTKCPGLWTNMSGSRPTFPIRSTCTVSVINNIKPTCCTHWLFKRTGSQLLQHSTPTCLQRVGVKTTVPAWFQRSPENTPDKYSPAFPSDSGMTLYLTAENGYLSWMRNTYIMTVVLVGTANLDMGYPAPAVYLVIVLTAVSNMLIGSLGFTMNLNSIKRRGHISSGKCFRYQAAALLHLVCWLSALLLLAAVSVAPHVEMVDDLHQDGGSADE